VTTPVTHLQAVIFDLDGTLIDSTAAYCEIVQRSFARMSLPEPTDQAIKDAAHAGDFDWHKVIPESEHYRLDDLIAVARKHLADITDETFRRAVRLLPGAADTIRGLVALGTQVGIATATQRQWIDIKMESLQTEGIDSHIGALVISDDVANKKPAPDQLLECARRLGIEPNRCAYVGDTRVDIIAGRAAGMTTIAVYSGFERRDQVETAQPDFLISGVDRLNEIIAF
jgi:HAD superfamily hydrolase (TIGR01509 family)